MAAKEGSRLTGEIQLREELGDLYGKVNGYDGKPTESQQAMAVRLAAQLTKAQPISTLLAKELPPAVNGALQAAAQSRSRVRRAPSGTRGRRRASPLPSTNVTQPIVSRPQRSYAPDHDSMRRANCGASGSSGCAATHSRTRAA